MSEILIHNETHKDSIARTALFMALVSGHRNFIFKNEMGTELAKIKVDDNIQITEWL